MTALDPTDSETTAFRGLDTEKDIAGRAYFWQGEETTKDESGGDNEKDSKTGHGLSAAFSKLTTSLSHALSSSLLTHPTTEDPSGLLSLNPHTNDTARLRRCNALSAEELGFLDARVRRIAKSGSLAGFLGLEGQEEVDERDVPIIALGGSGGGMRANLGFLATIIALQDLELYPNITYLAGVSGACWGIAALYTLPPNINPNSKTSSNPNPSSAPTDSAPSVKFQTEKKQRTRTRTPRETLAHFAHLAGTHPLSAAGVNRVARAEGGVKALVGPLVGKERYGQEVCIIDLYSTMTSAYYWLVGGGGEDADSSGENGDGKTKPKEETKGKDKGKVDPASLIWSRAYTNGGLEEGREAWPILTAVRHERPWHDWKSDEEAFEEPERVDGKQQTEDRDAWWQWFEINPVEVGSEELQGWVPTWAFGRQFKAGLSTQFLPEYSLALLLGVATAAPAAPLSAFLGTLWRNLPQNWFGGMVRHVTQKLSKHAGDHAMDRIDNVNPVHAGNQANPFFGAEKAPHRGNGFENAPRLHLVDSGMANNLPAHVFLHPARDVDVMILFDASSDVQKGSAIARINEYGATKGLVFTPRVKFPDLEPLPMVDSEEKEEREKGKKVPKQLTPEEMVARFAGRYAQILDGVPKNVVAGRQGVVYNDKHQPQAWREVLLVYLPLLPNAVNPTYDPSTAPFSSSYNLVWTPEEVDSIYTTAAANVRNGIETIRQAVREAYERRRAARLAGTSNPVDIARENTKRLGSEMDYYVAGVPDPVSDTGMRTWMEE
ncbi:lysophospholipase [Favolaschia claudopus]|uniref:Lysophospholipase n=1 Tax=Favolaschia claudopus TaxID=2862362 RepID=A0AAW0BTB9_9AGAR